MEVSVDEGVRVSITKGPVVRVGLSRQAVVRHLCPDILELSLQDWKRLVDTGRMPGGGKPCVEFGHVTAALFTITRSVDTIFDRVSPGGNVASLTPVKNVEGGVRHLSFQRRPETFQMRPAPTKIDGPTGRMLAVDMDYDEDGRSRVTIRVPAELRSTYVPPGYEGVRWRTPKKSNVPAVLRAHKLVEDSPERIIAKMNEYLEQKGWALQVRIETHSGAPREAIARKVLGFAKPVQSVAWKPVEED